MAMTSGTNKWASRAVVVLQLAAWSAVGIVLLQKGVSSLQKESAPRNITQIVPLSPSNYRPPEKKDLTVIPLNTEADNSKLKIVSKHQNTIWNSETISSSKNHLGGNLQLSPPSEGQLSAKTEFDEEHDGPKVLESVDKLAKSDLGIKKESLDNKYQLKKTTQGKKYGDSYVNDVEELISHDNNNNSNNNLNDDKNSHAVISMKLIDSNNSSESNIPNTKKNSQRLPDKTDDNVLFNSPHIDIFNSNDSNNNNNNNKTTPVSTPKPSVWETKRRLRLSHLSGGGAAAAVAMVAVGAVMLVLGPAVIVLRAIDERRQERRFLKLSARDDLPPTYEQATLMDEAPRYSSLSLNTILGPPPPPSPTPARVHLV